MFVEAERPPDVLVNVLVEPPGMLAIVGEVQLHMRDILLLKESAFHRLYEIVRASSIGALFENTDMDRVRATSTVRVVRESVTNPLVSQDDVASRSVARAPASAVAPEWSTNGQLAVELQERGNVEI